jgi:hypothetical protein
MKPLKGILPVAMWLLRISVVIFAVTNFWPVIKTFSLNGVYYFAASAFLIFSVLLFLGGFTSKSTMTVFSALALFLTSLYMLFDLYAGFSLHVFLTYFPFLFIASVALLFAATGNKT